MNIWISLTLDNTSYGYTYHIALERSDASQKEVDLHGPLLPIYYHHRHRHRSGDTCQLEQIFEWHG